MNIHIHIYVESEILPGRINVSGVKCDVYAPMDKRYRIVVF
jgi:hypothetical protein